MLLVQVTHRAAEQTVSVHAHLRNVDRFRGSCGEPGAKEDPVAAVVGAQGEDSRDLRGPSALAAFSTSSWSCDFGRYARAGSRGVEAEEVLVLAAVIFAC